MAYWLDDDWDGGPMLRKAGTAAFGLYSRCGLWIARHLNDGFVPSDVAAELGTKEWAAKLVEAGLWAAVDGGFRDLHYLALNPSAEKVRARRQAEAERKAKWRSRRDKTRDTQRDSHVDTTRDSASPNPSPPKGGRGVGAPAGARPPLRPVPDWCGRCNKDTRTDVDDNDRSVRCPRCHPQRRAS